MEPGVVERPEVGGHGAGRRHPPHEPRGRGERLTLLALDIATRTGFCFGLPGAAPVYGHHRMAPPGAAPDLVFRCWRDWLTRQIEVVRPTHVYAEDQFVPHKASRDVMRRLMGMRAICEMVCGDCDLPLRWVPVTTVQRFFTTVGRWPKGEKKDATIRVCNLYGWHPATDDEADALAIWLYAEHQVAPRAAAGRSMGPLWARQRSASMRVS